MNYYNEIELSARRWLRELIKDGLIPDGYIDNRPIQEVQAIELLKEGFVQCHFFAGIGGWPLALRIAGWPDDRPCWSGSCPCQPFSGTGKKMGFSDSRHLFPTFRKLITRCQPSIVFGEQVSSKLGLEWLSRVRLEMATVGYAVRGGDYCSAGVGSPNRRQRLFWVGDTISVGHQTPRVSGASNQTVHKETWQTPGTAGRGFSSFWKEYKAVDCQDGKRRRISVKPEIYPLAARLPGDLGLIRGAGNAINPWVAAKFIRDAFPV